MIGDPPVEIPLLHEMPITDLLVIDTILVMLIGELGTYIIVAPLPYAE